MSTFTQNPKLLPETNPRDWAYELACLPQDANIIFTKDSLLRFLKTHNIDVSPNYVEINKLPKYAQIGKMSTATTTEKDVSQLSDDFANLNTTHTQPPRAAPSPPVMVSAPTVESTPAVAPISVQSTTNESISQSTKLPPSSATTGPGLLHNPDVVTPDGEEFRPTRRVREPIGGGSAQISALFGSQGGENNEREDYTLEAARESDRRRGLLQEKTNYQQPSSNVKSNSNTTTKVASSTTAPGLFHNPDVVTPDGEEFRPTRRVREPIGGGSAQISALFG